MRRHVWGARVIGDEHGSWRSRLGRAERVNRLPRMALRSTAGRGIAQRHVGAAVAGADGERSARERKRGSERRERRGRQLPQRSKPLQFWGLVHGVSEVTG